MSDEQQIRALIEAWAAAAHDGDLATVLADHAPDIVMFDVPPPNRGVRGIQAMPPRGRRSSPGSPAGLCSRSSHWRSPLAPRSPSLSPCCAVGLLPTLLVIRSSGCGLRSACARRAAVGS